MGAGRRRIRRLCGRIRLPPARRTDPSSSSPDLLEGSNLASLASLWPRRTQVSPACVVLAWSASRSARGRPEPCCWRLNPRVQRPGLSAGGQVPTVVPPGWLDQAPDPCGKAAAAAGSSFSGRGALSMGGGLAFVAGWERLPVAVRATGTPVARAVASGTGGDARISSSASFCRLPLWGSGGSQQWVV
jgi:hypothetical protein